jgi:hypothetical protein
MISLSIDQMKEFRHMRSENTNPAADRIADAIIALINSRPASPTKAEIAAVIAGNMSSPPMSRDVAAGREWSRLAAELEAAYEISGELFEGTPEGAAAWAVTQAAAARYNACCEQIWAGPPAYTDIGLLAQVLYHQCHGGSTLTSPDADERLAEGPRSYGGPIDKAQAALLKAIRAQYLGGAAVLPPPNKRLNTVNEIIAWLGGPTGAAVWTGVSAGEVERWLAHDQIPPGWHLRLFLWAQSEGYEICPHAVGLRADGQPIMREISVAEVSRLLDEDATP